jgi:hypothetical protein
VIVVTIDITISDQFTALCYDGDATSAWLVSENGQESEDFPNGIGGTAGSAKLTRVALG